jgi:hypothetical protein
MTPGTFDLACQSLTEVPRSVGGCLFGNRAHERRDGGRDGAFGQLTPDLARG